LKTRPCLAWALIDSEIASRLRRRPKDLPRSVLRSWKRCSIAAIRLKIEMRCATRRKGSAFQHYRRHSVKVRHATIIHRRQVQHQSSRGMFIALWMARLPLRHRPIVLRSPVNGSESAIGRGCIIKTLLCTRLLRLSCAKCPLHAGVTRVTTFPSTLQYSSKYEQFHYN
jgi:hypothetical protein